jgi:L-ascorbate metabolism protein UlaG (beta-lactamase superfamily)
MPATGDAGRSTLDDAVRITYVGHATLLLEVGGRRFLTDPNFEGALGRVLPRVSAPGVALAELPALDALLLTHAHADHLSFSSLDALPRSVPLFAPPAVAAWLRRRGYSHAEAIAPGETARVGDVELSAAAAQHEGSRYGVDRWRGAANMYLLEATAAAAEPGSCFFAGDTGLTPTSHAPVAERLARGARGLDVALLPIGWAPWWKFTFRSGHLTSDDAITLFERLGARYMIPYHWGTFNHVTSGAHDAITRLRARLGGYAERDRVRILEPGEAFAVPGLETRAPAAPGAAEAAQA